MRVRTTDRGNAIHTVESVGRTRELTREGYLLCLNVRIARTGEMLYAADELPELEPGKDLIIRATRSEDDLFRPETIASFNGKPVTNGHPDDDVTPDNWNELAVGIVLNCRRGDGADNQYLLADLLITDADTIKDILGDGDLEVSNGYDADYEQPDGPGRARQFNIIGNHVARVDKGRCGPTCAIGDREMITRDKKRSWKDRIMTAFKARDEEALTEAMQMADDEMSEGASEPQTLVIKLEAPAASTTVADDKEEVAKEETKDDAEVAPAYFTKFADDVTGRLDALEKARTSDEAADKDDDKDRTDDEDELDLGQTMDAEGGEKGDDEDKEDKGGTKDRKGTRDSGGLLAEVQEFKSRAEILVPGVTIPTFDAKDPATRTTDRLCAMRRRVLAKAYDEAETHDVIAPLFGGKKPNFKAMTCDAAKLSFTAASELVRHANTAISSVAQVHDHASGAKPSAITDINARNRDFWAAKGGTAK